MMYIDINELLTHHKEPDIYVKQLYNHASFYGSFIFQIQGLETL